MTPYEPYMGLHSYGIHDADRFFGRERESGEIRALIHANRVTLVYGRPGVGKTSLVKAGVLAAMGSQEAQVLPVVRLPRLVGTPPNEVNPLVEAVLLPWARGRIEDQGPTLAGFLVGLPQMTNDYEEPLPLVVTIDQFEEVFGDDAGWQHHRDVFLQQVAQAAEEVERLRLVLLLKEDALGQMLLHERALSGRQRGVRYRVGPLDRVAALQAIQGPLRPTRRRFEEGAADLLVDRLRVTGVTDAAGGHRILESATVEPIYLQVACTSLWEALPDDVTVITAAHINNYGSVEGALQAFCAHAVTQVSEREKVPEAAIWEWLAREFVTSAGTRDTTSEGLWSVGGMHKEVAWALEERRILMSERRSGTVQFELSHDGLINAVTTPSGRRSDSSNGVGGPERSSAYRRLAAAALADHMPWLAEEYARVAVDASLDDPVEHAAAHQLLGDLLWGQAKEKKGTLAENLYSESAECFRQAIEMLHLVEDRKSMGRVQGTLAQLYSDRHHISDALAAFRQAVMHLPDDTDLRMGLASTLRAAGQAQGALQEYSSVLTRQPGRVEALIERARILVKMDKADAALGDLEEAVSRDPGLAANADVDELRARARRAHLSDAPV